MQDMQGLLAPGGFEELAAFVAVAEAGSFTAAAKLLDRDASVLSRRVSQLEQRLGVRLLSRTTRRIALTETGDVYCRRVRMLLDELANASQEAADHAALPQGLVRVSLPVSFGRQWISPLLPPFLKRHPQIRIDARFSDRYVDIVAEGFDLALRVTASDQRDSSLTTRKIASYRNLLLAAPSYLAGRAPLREPDDLREHDCLGFTGYGPWPDWPLTKKGKVTLVRPKYSLIADNSEVLLEAAIEGSGVSLLPDWLAGPALRDGRLAEVLPEWSGRGEGGVYAILPPGRLVPAKTRIFVDEVAEAIKAGWA